MRSRELIIKGQEILTADKVALRVSIVVQFIVTDPKAAIHAVEKFEDRLYSDVQLAARRALARMTLEEILTNRTRLSSEILEDVKESGGGLWRQHRPGRRPRSLFPRQRAGGDEPRAHRRTAGPGPAGRGAHEVGGAAHRIGNQGRAAACRGRGQAEAIRQEASAKAAATETAVAAETQALDRRRANAAAYAEHPALLRLEELATLRQLATNANARLYLSLPADMPKAAKDDS